MWSYLPNTLTCLFGEQFCNCYLIFRCKQFGLNVCQDEIISILILQDATLSMLQVKPKVKRHLVSSARRGVRKFNGKTARGDDVGEKKQNRNLFMVVMKTLSKRLCFFAISKRTALRSCSKTRYKEAISQIAKCFQCVIILKWSVYVLEFFTQYASNSTKCL